MGNQQQCYRVSIANEDEDEEEEDIQYLSR